jgi:hypothetical protein
LVELFERTHYDVRTECRQQVGRDIVLAGAPNGG